jgi:acetylornithine deacetylase/succinyl-diaminopimelate desuccinylase-like protein
MDKKNLFWYVTVFMVGIFCFSSLALAQQKEKMDRSKELRERIIASVKEEELVEFIKEIMRAGQPAAENYPFDPSKPIAKEEGVSLVVADKIQAMGGFDVQLLSEIAGRPNVVGIKKGSGGGPSLILNDHLDTWPGGDRSKWTMTSHDPFNPTMHGRFLYGRGAADTRGNLACQLFAVKTLMKLGLNFKGDLILAYTVDEERGVNNGAKFLLEKKGLKADYALVAEPTTWRKNGEKGTAIAVAHGGTCILELETKGKKMHLQRPDAGINAILKMAHLLSELEKAKFTYKPSKAPGLTLPMISVNWIESIKPEDRQFVPDICTVGLSVVALVPGMTKESVLSDIQKVIDRLKAEDKDFHAEVRPSKIWDGFMPPTVEAEDNALHLNALMKSYEEVTGKKPMLVRKNSYTDAVQFSLHGIPALTFGPGDDAWSAMNEFIDMDQAMIATRVYALAIARILGVED